MSEATKTEFSGLIDALELPIVVLSPDAKLARFNAAAARLLSLTPSDLGQSLRHVQALAGVVTDVEDLSEHVIAGGAVCQREVRTRDGSWFVVRAAPHAGVVGPITGAVLTF